MTTWNRSVAAFVVAAAAPAILALAASPAPATRTKSETVAHVPGKPLEVERGSGDIQIRKSAGDKVNIRAEISAETAERAKAVRIRTERDDSGALRVGVEWPDGERKGFESVAIRVDIPDASEIKAHSDNGDVELEGLSGEADLSATNGAVRVRGFKGTLKFEFRNGQADLRDVDGEIRGKGVNGGASMVKVSGPVTFETTNGRLDVRLKPESKGPVELKATNGGIDLSIGKSFCGSIRARAMNGKTDIELPGMIKSTKQDGWEYVVDLVAAGDSSTLSTSNGQIRVRVDE